MKPTGDVLVVEDINILLKYITFISTTSLPKKKKKGKNSLKNWFEFKIE